MAATQLENCNETSQNLEDAGISFSSRGGASIACLLGERKFGESTLLRARSFMDFPTLLKILLILVVITCFGLIIWASSSNKKTQKSIHIDDYQAEKIKELENKLKKFESLLEDKTKSLENKLNTHINHFIASKLPSNSALNVSGLDLSSVNDIPIMKAKMVKVVTKTKENSEKIEEFIKGQSITVTDESLSSTNLLLNLGNKVETLRNEVNTLKQKQGTTTAKNCEEIFGDATKSSGDFTIDPDGDGAIEPFTVFCDTVKRATIVKHDKMENQIINNCTTKDCYQLNIQYETSIDQISALIDSSESCKQMIRFNCYLSKLTHFGEWSDRYNERQSYFSGSEYGQKLCECGIKDPNECFQLSNSQNMCNCDQKDPVERNDIGYITNMTALPIRSFHYGLMYLPSQRASITIGALECKGTAKVELDGVSCHSLKLQGRPSGYYILDRSNNATEQSMDNNTKPVLHVSRCKMNLSLTDPDFQMDLGFINLFIGRVNIVVETTATHRVTQGSPIPFDRVVMDPTESFFMHNSTFVAPFSAMFSFSKHRFRCARNDRDMYGYIIDNHGASSSFEILTSDTEKFLQKGQGVVITRKDSSITLGCTQTDPCRLIIKGEE